MQRQRPRYPQSGGIKPRFFVILSVLLVLIAFLVYRMGGHKVALDMVFTTESQYTQNMRCVVIRDEKVFASSTTVRTEYLAAEDTYVYEGDVIANLYSTGYTQSLLSKLETTRQNIQEYHKQLLGTIIDSSLDRLDAIVDMTAAEFRNVANGTTQGNLRFTIAQLKTAMSNRQDYLRANKRDDTKLTKLYDEENSRRTAIQAWQTQATAGTDGVVSFYLDGYENDLTPALLEHLTPADLESVFSGSPLSLTKETLSSGIYRIVDQDKWYVAVLCENENWNPVTGQTYYLQLDKYPDLAFDATVLNTQKTTGKLLAVFGIEDPIGPAIYDRADRASLSISLTSLAVHTKALDTINGETGVWLYDGTATGTFVPVQVLSRDGDTSLIQASVEGSLESGQRILVK